MTLRTLLAALLLCLCLPVQAATEVLPLNYRTADDVLGIVQSVLGNEGRVSAYGSQLIVNAPAEKINEVRQLLEQLDTRPRRLLISVESTDSSHLDDRGYRVDGTLSSGSGEVQIGRGEIGGRDQVRIIRRSTGSRSGGTQQVQATEGYPALIQVGQSVPLTTTSTGPYGQIHQDTQYRDVTRGFYVTATLSGELVHVNISSQRDRLNRHQPGVIDVQSTDSRVSGRLGEWITLGGISEDTSSSGRDILQRRTTQGREDMTLRVKVEALD